MRRHLLSIILTLTPALASAFDAKSPAGPAPMMRTSALVSLISAVGMLTIRMKRMKRAAWVVFIYFRIGPYRINHGVLTTTSVLLPKVINYSEEP